MTTTPITTERKPSGFRIAAGVIGVGLYLVLSWLALAVVIVFGALADCMLFDRFHLLAASLTTPIQAWWLWAGGLGFSLTCYALGVYRAAEWFALVPQMRQRQARANKPARTRPESVPEHEIVKTAPSPEEIAKRGYGRR